MSNALDSMEPINAVYIAALTKMGPELISIHPTEILDEMEKKDRVSRCSILICPKRVGGYDLQENTACPVGGILLGALSYMKGETPKLPKVNLKPGELCSLSFKI